MEGDKEVVLRGVVAERFIYQEAFSSPALSLQWAKEEIDILARSGANFVAIDWNSGTQYRNRTYVNNLLAILEYARSKGLRVELRLHSRGIQKGSTWAGEQITHLNRQVYEDWQWLLGDPAIARRFKQHVDIFGIVAETPFYDEGPKSIRNPILTDTAKLIRQLVNNPSAICSIGGPEWSRDASELIGVNPSLPNNDNIIIRVHPYEVNSGNYGFFDWVNTLRGEGYLVYVGEFGMLDSYEYNMRMIRFLEQYGISYSYYAIDEKGGTDRFFYSEDGFSPEGKYLIQTWAQNRSSR